MHAYSCHPRLCPLQRHFTKQSTERVKIYGDATADPNFCHPTTEGNYSPPSPLDLPYPFTASSIYPDRPIRPLPRRRLRTRLTPETVDSILFPQSPSSPINGAATERRNDVASRTVAEMSNGTERDSYQFRGSDLEDGVVESVGSKDSHLQRRQKSTSAGTTPSRAGYVGARNDNSRYTKTSIPPSAASSADSVDGYDSFENTNNKKKRKIPISGSIGGHHSSLSADLAHMDISSTRDIELSQDDADGSGVSHYYGTGNTVSSTASHGGSGGKNRFGRASTRRYSGRSPLAPSINGSNATQPVRTNQNFQDPTAMITPSKLGKAS